MRQRKPKDLEKRIDECGAFLVRDPGPDAWGRCFTGWDGSITSEPGKAQGHNEFSEPGKTQNHNGFSEPVKSPEKEGSSDAYGERRKLFVEIGCGKGDFIVAKAMDDPASNYLGIEGQESVLLRALEKATWLAENMASETVPVALTDDAATVASVLASENVASNADCTITRPLGNLRFAGVYVRSMKDLFEEGSLAGIYLNFSDPWPKKRHYKRRLTWRGRLKEYAWALRPGGAIEIKTDNDDLFDFTLEEVEALGWKPEIMTRDLHSTDLEARLTMTEYEKKFHRAGKAINYLKLVPWKRNIHVYRSPIDL